MEGMCVLTWTFGRRYEGYFKNDMRNGYGKEIFETGKIYDGEWKDNKKNGYGKIYFKGGNVYYGEWKDDEINGYGTYICETGEWIHGGMWLNNKRHGRGILLLKEDPVIGEWVNGELQGKILRISKSSEIFEENWSDGKSISSQKILGFN